MLLKLHDDGWAVRQTVSHPVKAISLRECSGFPQQCTECLFAQVEIILWLLAQAAIILAIIARGYLVLMRVSKASTALAVWHGDEK